MWNIELLLKALAAAHPWFGPDCARPIGECRDAAKVISDVLFPDQTDRNGTSVAIHEDSAERPLQVEDTLGVVAQGAV